MLIPVLLKEPAENFVTGFDFANVLPSGRTVASGVVGAIDQSDDSDASNIVLASTTATIDGAQVLGRVIAGTAGTRYKVTFTITLDDASVLQEQLQLRVIDV